MMAVVLLLGVVVACTPNFVVMYALQFKNNYSALSKFYKIA